jgi:hypothetical protein
MLRTNRIWNEEVPGAAALQGVKWTIDLNNRAVVG